MNPSQNFDSNARTRLKRLPLALALAGLLGATALTAPSALAPFEAHAASASANIIPAAAPATGFADLVEQIQPAVVSVRVSPEQIHLSSQSNTDERGQLDRQRGSDDEGNGQDGTEYRSRKGGALERQDEQGLYGSEPQVEPYRESQGSGFVISDDGYVVTNYHVIEDGGRIEVTMSDGTVYTARLIGKDSKTDLALLKIDADRTFEFVSFAETEARVGDWIIAIGNPFGLGNSVTTGIVSARGRDIGSGPYDDYIQIDAPINRGNSGGPAFNLQGEVIGVNTAIYSPSGGNVGIGFAIPASIASDVIEELRDDGTVTRGWLGVHIQSVTNEIAESLDLDTARGALVAQVASGSPAEAGGIEVGDLIVEVNGHSVADPKELARIIAAVDPGEAVDVALYRNGELMSLSVDIGLMPGSEQQASVQQEEPAATASVDVLGLTLSSTGSEGVLVDTVDAGGPAESSGLQQGDVILEVGGERVSTPADVENRLAALRGDGKNAVLLLVRSGDRQRFVALQVDQG